MIWVVDYFYVVYDVDLVFELNDYWIIVGFVNVGSVFFELLLLVILLYIFDEVLVEVINYLFNMCVEV